MNDDSSSGDSDYIDYRVDGDDTSTSTDETGTNSSSDELVCLCVLPGLYGSIAFLRVGRDERWCGFRSGVDAQLQSRLEGMNQYTTRAAAVNDNRRTCCLRHTGTLRCGGRPNGNHSFTFRGTLKNATPFPLASFGCNTDGDDHQWLLCVLVLTLVRRVVTNAAHTPR